ncbi:MAG: CHASE2 domain-containing protein [Candidatus Omnitrophica bacterium]|nr:CHASE2 domain-containing protein [Candidatus Omnitrophota bacterium]
MDDLPLRYIHSNSFFQKILTQRMPKLKIYAVGIDDESISKIESIYPFRRSIYAKLLKTLNEEKVKVVAFDLVFRGKSQDPTEDTTFAQAIKQITDTKVILAFMFNYYGSDSFILPEPEFQNNPNCVLGLVDVPTDKDGVSRRLFAYVNTNTNTNTNIFPNSAYSLSLQLAATTLGVSAEKLVKFIPLVPYRAGKIMASSFFINYLVKPTIMQTADLPPFSSPTVVKRIRFYDLYANLEKLKKLLGEDFLKDSIVFIYPDAEVLHDTVITPLGKWPGGYLHLNGFLNIISQKFLVKSKLLTLLGALVCCGLVLYLSPIGGLGIQLIITCGVLILGFWYSIIFRFMGIELSFAIIALSILTFSLFILLYKYLRYLVALAEIKHKVSQDPVRGLYTLRYFCYYFDFVAQRFYFGRKLYCIFILFESLKDELQDMPLASIRRIWQMIRQTLQIKGSFWAVYSSEAVVGAIPASKQEFSHMLEVLSASLRMLFEEKALKVKVKICYLLWHREYRIRQVLAILFDRINSQTTPISTVDEESLNILQKRFISETQLEQQFLELLDADLEEKNRQLLNVIEELKKEQIRNQEIFFEVILSLVNALEARDPYTQGHSTRVMHYALSLADRLGWSKQEKEKLRKAALLHDLGKIGIPDSILHKKERLTDEEYDFIKKHEIIAIRILEPLKGMADILPWILYHHERWDGKGYPHGLGGDAIPQAAQILALADVYDALTTGRDYKKALSVEEALAEIERAKGIQFNPALADTFIQMIRQNIISYTKGLNTQSQT